MAKVQRMTKGSKLRRIAKRALPKQLNEHRRKGHAAAIEAKQPREPRIVQRERRLKALAERKAELAKQQKSALARFGLAPAAA